MSNEPAIRLAAKLAELAPGNLNAVFFTSGGLCTSESNDTAYKLARYYWKLKGLPDKKKIISQKKGYHGVNIGATSATGISPFHTLTNSPAPDFVHVDTFLLIHLRHVLKRKGKIILLHFLLNLCRGLVGSTLHQKAIFKKCELFVMKT